MGCLSLSWPAPPPPPPPQHQPLLGKLPPSRASSALDSCPTMEVCLALVFLVEIQNQAKAPQQPQQLQQQHQLQQQQQQQLQLPPLPPLPHLLQPRPPQPQPHQPLNVGACSVEVCSAPE